MVDEEGAPEVAPEELEDAAVRLIVRANAQIFVVGIGRGARRQSDLGGRSHT